MLSNVTCLSSLRSGPQLQVCPCVGLQVSLSRCGRSPAACAAETFHHLDRRSRPSLPELAVAEATAFQQLSSFLLLVLLWLWPLMPPPLQTHSTCSLAGQPPGTDRDVSTVAAADSFRPVSAPPSLGTATFMKACGVCGEQHVRVEQDDCTAAAQVGRSNCRHGAGFYAAQCSNADVTRAETFSPAIVEQFDAFGRMRTWQSGLARVVSNQTIWLLPRHVWMVACAAAPMAEPAAHRARAVSETATGQLHVNQKDGRQLHLHLAA